MNPLQCISCRRDLDPLLRRRRALAPLREEQFGRFRRAMILDRVIIPCDDSSTSVKTRSFPSHHIGTKENSVDAAREMKTDGGNQVSSGGSCWGSMGGCV
jgi:hypothetical protein